MKDVQSRVVLDIDLEILAQNFRKIAQSVDPLGTLVVLKANAYGLGMRPVARTLARAGAAGIATAELSEALAAADLGLPVMILGTLLPGEYQPAIQAGIRIPIAGIEEARMASETAERLGVTARAHLVIDSGMGRVGIRLQDARVRIREIDALPHLMIEGLYSHFPTAYIEQDADTHRQIDAVRQLIRDVQAGGISIPWLHIANSDAINNFPDAACTPPFTHVRSGINLYGSFDIVGNRHLRLRPVLTLRARLAQIRTLPAGSTIGYGRTFTCPRDMRIGTVAAGYADGLPLALSNRGSLLIRGRRCPVLGRVSMDYTNVALDQVEDAVAGDDVICVGSEQPNANSVESWATLKGTHPYEIICSIGSRVQRHHLNGPDD